MTKTIRLALAPALGALLLAAPGCGDSSPAGPSGSARLAVYLTDAPGDVRTAMVTIDRVYLQGEAGRTVLREEDLTVDLLTLVDAAAELVPESGVPAGTYQELRVVISGGYLEVENADGSTSIYASSPSYAGLPAGATVAGQLQMPSFAQSGLKVQLPEALTVAEGETHLLVDFDVRESFGRAAGQSGRWVMSPVLRGSRLAEPPADSLLVPTP